MNAYTLRSAGEGVLLAGEMLDAAVAEEEPARRFALLRAASNMAAQNGDAALAVGAVEVMAETFEFDAVQARAAMLRREAVGAARAAQSQCCTA